MEVQRSYIKQDAYNMPQVLQQQASLDMWIDPNTLWVSGANNMTATQNQTIQKNSNLRMILWSKVDGWAEKEFREMWYAFYQVNFKNKEKAFRLWSALEATIQFETQQFITDSDIDVEVVTESSTIR